MLLPRCLHLHRPRHHQSGGPEDPKADMTARSAHDTDNTSFIEYVCLDESIIRYKNEQIDRRSFFELIAGCFWLSAAISFQTRSVFETETGTWDEYRRVES